MIISTVRALFIKSLITYRDQFLKIFTLSFFYTVVSAIIFFGMLWSPYTLTSLFSSDIFLNIAVDDRIALALEQIKIFPFLARWTLFMLAMGKFSAVLVRIVYLVAFAVIQVISLGFIRSLCRVYDKKDVSLRDLFFSYKAALRAFFIMIICGILLFLVGYAVILTPMLGEPASIIVKIGGVLFLVWLSIFSIMATYGAITTEDPIFMIIKKSVTITLHGLLVLLLTIIFLIVMGSLMMYGSNYIFGMFHPTKIVILWMVVKNMVIMPLMIFSLFGAYKAAAK